MKKKKKKHRGQTQRPGLFSLYMKEEIRFDFDAAYVTPVVLLEVWTQTRKRPVKACSSQGNSPGRRSSQKVLELPNDYTGFKSGHMERPLYKPLWIICYYRNDKRINMNLGVASALLCEQYGDYNHTCPVCKHFHRNDVAWPLWWIRRVRVKYFCWHFFVFIVCLFVFPGCIAPTASIHWFDDPSSVLAEPFCAFITLFSFRIHRTVRDVLLTYLSISCLWCRVCFSSSCSKLVNLPAGWGRYEFWAGGISEPCWLGRLLYLLSRVTFGGGVEGGQLHAVEVLRAHFIQHLLKWVELAVGRIHVILIHLQGSNGAR